MRKKVLVIDDEPAFVRLVMYPSAPSVSAAFLLGSWPNAVTMITGISLIAALFMIAQPGRRFYLLYSINSPAHYGQPGGKAFQDKGSTMMKEATSGPIALTESFTLTVRVPSKDAFSNTSISAPGIRPSSVKY